MSFRSELKLYNSNFLYAGHAENSDFDKSLRARLHFAFIHFKDHFFFW